MTKTAGKTRELVSVRLSLQNTEILDQVKVPHLNKSSLINRALEFGLERAIREMMRSVEPERQN
jgi:pyridoxine 5'-phosphate synthase PdxJ